MKFSYIEKITLVTFLGFITWGLTRKEMEQYAKVIVVLSIASVLILLLQRLIRHVLIAECGVSVIKEYSHNIHSYIQFIITNNSNSPIIIDKIISLSAFTLQKNKFYSKFKIDVEKTISKKPLTIKAGITNPPITPLDFLFYKIYTFKLLNGKTKKIRYRTLNKKLSYIRFYIELFLWKRKNTAKILIEK